MVPRPRALFAGPLAGLLSSAGAAAPLTVAAGGAAVAVATLPLVPAYSAVLGSALAALGLLIPRVALAALLFSIPFSRWFQFQVGELRGTATDLLVALVLVGWITRGLGQGRLDVRMGPTLWAAVALFGSALLSLQAVRDFPPALGELIKLAEMTTMGIYAASTLRSPGDIRFVLAASVFAAAAEAVVGLIQFFRAAGPASFALGSLMRAYGDFDQPNALAGYLGMVLPLGIVLSAQPARMRPAFMLATLVIAAGLTATFSRGAWLGTALGLTLMGILWSQTTRRMVPAIVLAVSAAGIMTVGGVFQGTLADRLATLAENFVIFDARKVTPDPSNWSVVERMAHWQAGWAMAMDHPWTGVGPGNYEEAYSRYFLPGWPYALAHAHNLYINTFAELGAIGLAAFLAFTAAVFVRPLQGIRRSGLDPPFRRAILVGVLGTAMTFSTHNVFDNMLVHGMGVQLGLLLGIVEVAVRGWSQEATEGEEVLDAHRH